MCCRTSIGGSGELGRWSFRTIATRINSDLISASAKASSGGWRHIEHFRQPSQRSASHLNQLHPPRMSEDRRSQSSKNVRPHNHPMFFHISAPTCNQENATRCNFRHKVRLERWNESRRRTEIRARGRIAMIPDKEEVKRMNKLAYGLCLTRCILVRCSRARRL